MFYHIKVYLIFSVAINAKYNSLTRLIYTQNMYINVCVYVMYILCNWLITNQSQKMVSALNEILDYL